MSDIHSYFINNLFNLLLIALRIYKPFAFNHQFSVTTSKIVVLVN